MRSLWKYPLQLKLRYVSNMGLTFMPIGPNEDLMVQPATHANW
jgi:hypothetical protein